MASIQIYLLLTYFLKTVELELKLSTWQVMQLILNFSIKRMGRKYLF